MPVPKKYKKNGSIILNAYEVLPPIREMANRLKDEFSLLGYEINEYSNADVLAYLNGKSQVSKRKAHLDFAIYLDKDPYYSALLEKQGVRLFNSATSIETCDDQMKTYLALVNSGLSIPKTVQGPLRYSQQENEKFLENLTKILNFPIVCKINYGSQGKNVFLARDLYELKQIEDKISFQPRLFQELISSSWGVDYRLIVIGGKYVAGMRRESQKGDFRSNIALGGIGENMTMPDDFVIAAEKAAQVLKLDYAGVDILAGPNKEPIICEVNSNAFIEGIEKVTGVNVAKAYAEHVIKTIE